MKILGIETSCDDTGIAILEISGENPADFKILANEVASQIKVHKKYGGVYPALAMREHQRNLLPTFLKALKASKLLKIFNFQFSIFNQNPNFKIKIQKVKEILAREPELAKKLIPFLKKYQKPDFDYIAITNGPGLEPCLWVGVNFARALSYFWDIPIIPVNHIEGHVLVNEISDFKFQESNFPAISLVVSGGHTQLVLVNKLGDYKIIGETRDDAAGECFDKCAKILGLSYPGGPEISRLAAMDNQSGDLIKLPRPMISTKDYDFSFSGLKTAVLYTDKKIKTKNTKYKITMAKEVQQAIIDVLLKKTFKAVKDYGAKSIILGGGVSANQELRKQFSAQASEYNIQTIYPPANLSTDNGLMIAVAGYFNKNKNISWENLKADSNLRIGE